MLLDVSLSLSVSTPGLTKGGKKTLPPLPGFQISHPGITALSLFSRQMHISKTVVHSWLRNTFHEHTRSRNIRQNPQRISELQASALA